MKVDSVLLLDFVSLKKCWFLKKEKKHRIILRKTSRSKEEKPGFVPGPHWWRQIHGFINGVYMVNWPPDEIKKLTFSALNLSQSVSTGTSCWFTQCMELSYWLEASALSTLHFQANESRPNRCNKSMSYFKRQWEKFILYLRPRLAKNDPYLF